MSIRLIFIPLWLNTIFGFSASPMRMFWTTLIIFSLSFLHLLYLFTDSSCSIILTTNQLIISWWYTRIINVRSYHPGFNGSSSIKLNKHGYVCIIIFVTIEAPSMNHLIKWVPGGHLNLSRHYRCHPDDPSILPVFLQVTHQDHLQQSVYVLQSIQFFATFLTTLSILFIGFHRRWFRSVDCPISNLMIDDSSIPWLALALRFVIRIIVLSRSWNLKRSSILNLWYLHIFGIVADELANSLVLYRLNSSFAYLSSARLSWHYYLSSFISSIFEQNLFNLIDEITFLNELFRRNLPRIGGVYIISALISFILWWFSTAHPLSCELILRTYLFFISVFRSPSELIWLTRLSLARLFVEFSWMFSLIIFALECSDDVLSLSNIRNRRRLPHYFPRRHRRIIIAPSTYGFLMQFRFILRWTIFSVDSDDTLHYQHWHIQQQSSFIEFRQITLWLFCHGCNSLQQNFAFLVSGRVPPRHSWRTLHWLRFGKSRSFPISNSSVVSARSSVNDIVFSPLAALQIQFSHSSSISEDKSEHSTRKH